MFVQRQARGDILFALSFALRESLCDSRKQKAESRLTDAYAMHFVSRRALLSPF